MACADIPADVRPSFLECTACSKKHEVRLMNTCDCGAPLFARYDWKDLAVQDLASRRDLWRYAPLLPLEETTIRSRGEGGTPLYKLESIGTGGRVARLRVAGLYVKDEGLNPTRTFKARGMAVAVPMASSLGATTLAVPTAGNAGAALAAYAATYGVRAIVIMARDGPAEQAREAMAYGAQLLQIDEDITDAGRIVNELATETETFSVATLREPYRVEGKKTMLLEIWEALGGMPDWILFPTGGGTGVAGMWKALQELRELGWYEGPWPRFGVVQAEGCAPRRTRARTSGSRRELLDFFEDALVVRGNFRVFRDPSISDNPIAIEDEDGSLRYALEAEVAELVVLHSVRLRHRLVPVAQQGVVDPVLLLEHPMAVVAVRANPEDGRAHLLEDSQGVAQRAQLTLTHVREVPDVEREDDRSPAERLRERDRLPFVTQHREIRRLLAHFHHRATSGRRASGVGAITLSLSTLTEPGRTRERNVYLTGAANQGST